VILSANGGQTPLPQDETRPGGQGCGPRRPFGFLRTLRPPAGTAIAEKLAGQYDWIQLFVKTRSELESKIGRTAKALSPAGPLWITFPKASSGIQTDLTRDKGWDSLKAHELKWISLIAVDKDWSAFALRRYKPNEGRQAFR
jgi:hypothetical protein